MEHQSRREQILLTAYEIAGHAGIEAVHARTIASDLQINHAAVHYYFRTRTDLLVALVEYTKKRYSQDFERVTMNQPNAGLKLEAQIALFEAYCKPQSRFIRVLTSLYVASLGYEPLQKPVSELLNMINESISSTLTDAKSTNAVLVGSQFSDSDALASYLMGLCMRQQMIGGSEPTAAIDRLLLGLMRR